MSMHEGTPQHQVLAISAMDWEMLAHRLKRFVVFPLPAYPLQRGDLVELRSALYPDYPLRRTVVFIQAVAGPMNLQLVIELDEGTQADVVTDLSLEAVQARLCGTRQAREQGGVA